MNDYGYLPTLSDLFVIMIVNNLIIDITVNAMIVIGPYVIILVVIGVNMSWIVLIK